MNVSLILDHDAQGVWRRLFWGIGLFRDAGEANDGESTLAKADVLVLDVNLPK